MDLTKLKKMSEFDINENPDPQDMVISVSKDGLNQQIPMEKVKPNIPAPIPGPAGPQGPKGDRGEAGIPGIQGPKGDIGQTGAQGGKGDKGDKGNIGERGLPGNTGAQGPEGQVGQRGERGERGLQGFQGPTGPKGEKGDQGDPATNLVTSVASKTGAVTLNKGDVGLGNVDDTNDLNKPVSTATQTALNGKVSTTGKETIAGVKTFTSSPVVPTATTNTQAVNKAQLDAGLALQVSKDGDTMKGRLQNSTSNMAISNNRGGKEILFGASSLGNFTAYDNTNGVEFFNAMSDGSGIRLGTSTGVAYLKGTGFPNGAISAPVGSIYIDTAVTNGASSWIKKSGTGNTGWQVLGGDTGWRNITSILTNGWTGVEVKVRRVNETIYWGFEALNASSSTSLNLYSAPVGFRSGGGFYVDRQFLTTATGPASVYRVTLSNTGPIALQNWSTSVPLLYGGLVTSTVDTWPTALPGTTF